MIESFFGIGVRMPRIESREHQNIVCCNVAYGAGVSWPLARTNDLIIAPYVGGETALLLSHDDVDRRNWIGVDVGLELNFTPLVPRNSPFPIDYPPSLLGAYNLRASLVHWFGEGRSPPSFGATLTLTTSYGL